MVARNKGAETSAGQAKNLPGRLLLAWRRLLTPLFRRPLNAAENTESGQPTPPVPAFSWVTSRWLLVLGIAGLAVGASLGIALAAPGQARALALLAGAETLLWAAVRWFLMRFTGHGAANDSRQLRGATALGLIAYAIALSPGLRLAAWVLSAGLTWVGLVIQGDRRREALRTVAIAWGAQAAVVLLSWIARGGIVAFLATRG